MENKQQKHKTQVKGKMLVPMRPTKAMILHAVRCMNDEQCMENFDATRCFSCKEATKDIYTLMLEASQR